MGKRKRKQILTKEEIASAFAEGDVSRYPAILKIKQLAELLNMSQKTIYEWKAKGWLDGSFRKRGKHILIWRDKVLDLLFNGEEWN